MSYSKSEILRLYVADVHFGHGFYGLPAAAEGYFGVTPRDEVVDIVRIVEGLSGAVRMRGELARRFDYGQLVPWVRRDKRGIRAVAGPDAAYLDTPAPVRGENLRTVSDFRVRAGERVLFVLTWTPSHLPRPRGVNPEKALHGTEKFWTSGLAGMVAASRRRRSREAAELLDHGGAEHGNRAVGALRPMSGSGR